MVADKRYSFGSCYQDTLLNYPDKPDCGIPAADGFDNSFQTYTCARMAPKNCALTVCHHGAEF